MYCKNSEYNQNKNYITNSYNIHKTKHIMEDLYLVLKIYA